MKMNLYDLKDCYIDILNYLEEEDDENMVKILDEVKDEIGDKCENIARLIQSIKGESEVLDLEIKRLQKKKKARENKIKSLKEYIEISMIMMDTKKIKTRYFDFNIQKNPPKLLIETEKYIPEEYYKIDRKLNKRNLLKDIKEEKVSLIGVSLQQSESLRIR